jgi:short-subunit dehydrogenase
MKYFIDKNVVVTGGSSGIGQQIVQQLLQYNPKKIIVLDRQSVASMDKRVEFFQIDLCKFEEVVRIFDSFNAEIDLLFNVAGVGTGGDIEDLELNDFQFNININYLASLNLIKILYPKMKKRMNGHIINITSLAGLVPLPGESPYVSSKFAARAMSDCLEIEAAQFNVQVTQVCPGVVDTPIYETSKLTGYDKKAVLSLWPKGISAARCAHIILKATSKKRRLEVITIFAKSFFYLERWFPSLLRVFFKLYMRKVRQFKTNTKRGSNEQSRKNKTDAKKHHG